MARRNPPSFDFFPDDFIAGTYHLEAEAVGIYVRLLCYQWSHGAVPVDEDSLARIAGTSVQSVRKHLPELLRKFQPTDCGGLANERLESERAKKLAVIEKAKASANKRWNRKNTGESTEPHPQSGGKEDANAMPTHCDRNANAMLDGMQNGCSLLPTSYVQLPSNITHTHTEFIDKNVLCPGWLVPEFGRWLAFRFARDGKKVDAISQETLILELTKRGEKKAVKDIGFSILKQAKNILDSDNDFEKAGNGGKGSRYQGRETAEESYKRMFG